MLQHLVAASAAAPTGLDASLDRLVTRIGENRIIAGVHFPVDMTAGDLLGKTIANALLGGDLGTADEKAPPPPSVFVPGDTQTEDTDTVAARVEIDWSSAKAWQALWGAAQEEWKRHFNVSTCHE